MELTNGFQSKTDFSFSFLVFLLPVALKKKAAANALIHKDKTLVSTLKMTKSEKTRIG